MFRNRFFYLAAIFFIFLFLALNYERSENVTKRLEQDVVASASRAGVYKGDLAQDFQLVNARGEMVRLSQFRGKKVILNFFATWCGPCQEEMPTLVELDKRLNNETFTIIGVNVTKEEPNPNQVKEFIKHYQVEYVVLFDGDGKVMKDYQLIGIPTTLFIDEKGKIIERLNGIVSLEMIKNHNFFDGKINQ
ncbi:TlpA family protein disulfide reductase [Anaerobacillus alkaliphilus]|uniref:TlpA family protein disulfide reductase n=1 Tax=Anaerobacillus alkaliphilus TaxID=1548597 RepID=A0A4Q0VQQ1_9BACI|nr:TlpA disulfide reductase family protein [Anaerobacillus alkaliphilus]RXI98247.1 TlpA family protein disulfide reductase [Anaerobacillus alkaliphilus]